LTSAEKEETLDEKGLGSEKGHGFVPWTKKTDPKA